MVNQYAFAKKLSFFISSTGTELAAERKAVISAIRDMRMNPVFFEGFGAHPQKPMEECLARVADSDFYIGIFWKQYSQPTEQEYRKARQLGRPCLIYLKEDDTDVQRDKDLETLIKDLSKSHYYASFRSPGELKDLVKESIAQEVTRTVQDKGAADNLATLQELAEKSGSLYELEATKSLMGKLVELAQVHSQLRAWNNLERLLDNLSDSFSVCYEEAKQSTNNGVNLMQMNVKAVERSWEACKGGPLSQLNELLKKGEFSLQEYAEVSTQEQTDFLDQLLQVSGKIDEGLRTYSLRALYDSLGEFQTCVGWFQTYARETLRRMVTNLCDLSNRLIGEFSKLSPT
jgi:hypothetical protein